MVSLPSTPLLRKHFFALLRRKSCPELPPVNSLATPRADALTDKNIKLKSHSFFLAFNRFSKIAEIGLSIAKKRVG